MLIKLDFTLLLLPKGPMGKEGAEPTLIFDGLSEVIKSTLRLPPNTRNDTCPRLYAYSSGSRFGPVGHIHHPFQQFWESSLSILKPKRLVEMLFSVPRPSSPVSLTSFRFPEVISGMVTEIDMRFWRCRRDNVGVVKVSSFCLFCQIQRHVDEDNVNSDLSSVSSTLRGAKSQMVERRKIRKSSLLWVFSSNSSTQTSLPAPQP